MALGPHPEFAWSASRASLFEFCPRKYFHRYHGMWRGWEDGAPARARLTYLLTKRTSLAEWAGREAHRGMAAYLQGGAPMEHILPELRQRMREQFRLSRAREFLKPGRAKLFGLLEHYYQEGGELADGEVRACWQHVEACLQAFARAGYREDARRARAAGRALHVEDPDSPDLGRMRFCDPALPGVTIYAMPDHLLAGEGGRVLILDWKTGRPPEEASDRASLQLALYALWARHRLGLDPLARGAGLEAYEVYWPGQACRGGELGPDDLQAALGRARESVQAIRACLADVDANAAREEDFPAQASPARCAACEFRAVCEARALPAPAPAPGGD
ncbi:MAG TPA: PD-(D/E)XK nuclease family protein [Myxococcota bacterium]|nr:PD-(D/E)XK nuclease family protein [Myxococcota bacterium]HRY95203.1 PD-(D/E)XK nuclease family protein [Myxococcota bacterium]HSA20516.1 PD-(D/E)XK nuclease family protein [Myxococcota bacterium]